MSGPFASRTAYAAESDAATPRSPTRLNVVSVEVVGVNLGTFEEINEAKLRTSRIFWSRSTSSAGTRPFGEWPPVRCHHHQRVAKLSFVPDILRKGTSMTEGIKAAQPTKRKLSAPLRYYNRGYAEGFRVRGVAHSPSLDETSPNEYGCGLTISRWKRRRALNDVRPMSSNTSRARFPVIDSDSRPNMGLIETRRAVRCYSAERVSRNTNLAISEPWSRPTGYIPYSGTQTITRAE